VDAARSDPPTPRARARAAQRREQELAARKERRIRQWERREQRDKEYRLCEKQGLSSPSASEYSSSGEREEEESDRGEGPPLEVGSCALLTESRRGGRGASARGGHGSAHHRAVCGRSGARHEGAGVRRGSIRERCSGDDGCHHSARRALEEEEAGILHLDVSSRSSRRSDFEGLELKFVSPCSQV
jgi:hypothetical protein